MPSPVVPWVQNQPLTAKSLNLSLYTSDGTADNTTGIAFATWRPILFEAYNTALTLHSSVAGTRASLASSGATTSCWVVFDSAGYFGQSQDLPANGYYQFTPAVAGSTGDGKTAGGWYLVAHFAPVTSTATQTAVGADLLQNGSFLAAGSRQQPISGVHGTPFFLDLVNAGTNTFAPAVLVDDSASANCAIVRNATDASGETPRFYAIWAGISASSTGQASFTAAGTYAWLAPVGVSSVTTSGDGAGAGGGAGNAATSTYGGGGGGAGESGQQVIGVTGDGQHSYPVTVGGGGTGGTQAGANGSNGGTSAFSGDTQSVSFHGGNFGAGATTAASGAGGNGGSGSAAPVHFNGGGGAAGQTNKFGGGGGSSGGTSSRGNTATAASGAPAVPGGGPGGAGGAPVIAVVQHATGQAAGNSLTVNFPGAIQAGNTVVAFVIYQGTGVSQGPRVTLSDGTQLGSVAQADMTSLNVPMTCDLYDTTGVTGGASGGQTGIKVTASGTHATAIGVQMYEVTGLGASPTLDVSGAAAAGGGHANISSYPPSGTVYPTSTKAPEVWFACAGGQQVSNFSVESPASSQGWALPMAQATPSADGSGTPYSHVYSRMLTGYQNASAAGQLKFSGKYSTALTGAWIVAAYAPGAGDTGQSPPIGPGGGGGGGFGQTAGGNGADGQITLTWTTASNTNYGTPALPAPQATWDQSTPATAALVNSSTGIAGVVNFLANPPVLRAHAGTAQSIPNATATTVALGTTDTDTYSTWNAATNTATVARSGLYLAAALVPFAANATGIRLAGITVNGTTYWGPACNGFAADVCGATKTQVFSFNAGDTVQVTCYQSSGAALNTATTAQARLVLVWLSAQGTPSPLPGAPDPGFRWQSGTPGALLPALMTQHLSQDLAFLVQKPYLLAYQSVAQTGLAQNAFSTVTLDTVTGIVHGDAGDNYGPTGGGGWTSGASNSYAAVVPGWHLVVGEMFTTSAAAGSSVIAGILPSTSGGYAPSSAPDWYQHLACTANATAGGGATIFGLHYLARGESLTPQVQGAAMGGSYGTLSATGLGGVWRSHMSVLWLGS